MVHPDEGTIHAWIDGQLDAEAASQLEAHIATCAECAASVREARGFVASSTRILGALDDVPAGITKSVTAPTASVQDAPAAARRMSARMPRVFALAATLALMASGAIYLLPPRSVATFDESLNAVDTAFSPVQPQVASRAAVPPAAPLQVAEQRVRSPEDGRASVGEVASARRTTSATLADTGKAQADAAMTVATAPPAPPVVAAAKSRVAADTMTAGVARERAGGGAGAALQQGNQAGMQRARTSEMAAFAPAPPPSPASLAGCYQVVMSPLRTANATFSLPSALQLSDAPSTDRRFHEARALGGDSTRYEWMHTSSSGIRLQVAGDSLRRTTLMLDSSGVAAASHRLRRIDCR